jgi:prevent-host-death family protein
MKTITITEAKRSLGQYLRQAAAGHDIGIVSGADIISLRKIEIVPADRIASSPSRKPYPGGDWPEFPTFDGGPADGALHHDKYLYDEPRAPRRKKSRR